jgi:hypothetical protein
MGIAKQVKAEKLPHLAAALRQIEKANRREVNPRLREALDEWDRNRTPDRKSALTKTINWYNKDAAYWFDIWRTTRARLTQHQKVVNTAARANLRHLGFEVNIVPLSKRPDGLVGIQELPQALNENVKGRKR